MSELNALKNYWKSFLNTTVVVSLIMWLVRKAGFTVLRQFASVTIRFESPKCSSAMLCKTTDKWEETCVRFFQYPWKIPVSKDRPFCHIQVQIYYRDAVWKKKLKITSIKFVFRLLWKACILCMTNLLHCIQRSSCNWFSFSTYTSTVFSRFCTLWLPFFT